ncbi:DNA polymerase III subunit delta [Rhizobium sp. CFBP 8762]|uniref:DNA polymerase III subunit delta n=1 Tax=Rhizobium sp. CFBP 8762 TaxID=2775279 RepID=UPI001782532C|nr:DNA polymerase III subunit delta [Rhizobium sp. CFBP 8762]MBD8556748.1 DNA polymerase III subunit delta [Rhizobium sp. CFBP 8762]
MSEIKSHEFDGFLQRFPKSVPLFLVYGPDRGLVSERASALAAKTGVKLDDPFSITRMDSTDLQNDAGRLLDETGAIGLFGGDKLVWLKASGTERSVTDGFKYLTEQPPQNCVVIIEAGDLKKGSALRKAAEGSRSAVAIPCYADDSRTINALIDQELGNADLTITPEARQQLREALGGDRMASRNEIQKLALYCRGQRTVELQHVLDIIGDASAISTDDAIDAVLKGDTDGLIQALGKITTSKTPIFLVLQGCLKQFQMLDVMRAEMDESRQSVAHVVAALGRGLHFRRKPLVEAALKQWTGPAIARELSRLQSAILQSRSRQTLEDTIATQTLLAITLQSARR